MRGLPGKEEAMGDIVIDEASRTLSEAGKEPKCPSCGSTVLDVSYVRTFIAYFDSGSSAEEAYGSPDPNRISCHACGEVLWTPPKS